MSEEYKKGLADGRKVIEEGTKPIIRDPLPPSLAREEEKQHEETVPESPLKAEDRAAVLADPNQLFRKRKNEPERPE